MVCVCKELELVSCLLSQRVESPLGGADPPGSVKLQLSKHQNGDFPGGPVVRHPMQRTQVQYLIGARGSHRPWGQLSLLAPTKESPDATMKTQHGQKLKKKEKKTTKKSKCRK